MKHHSVGKDQLSLFEEIEEEVETLEFKEEQVLQLIQNNNLVNFKKNIFLEAARFFMNQSYSETTTKMKNILQGASRENEYPGIYEPVNQTETFENLKIPIFFEEDGVLKNTVEKVLKHYFPDCPVIQESNAFVLELNSIPYRRFFYFSNLIRENEAWEGFINQKFTFEYDTAKLAGDIEREITGQQNSKWSIDKKEIILEDNPSLNYTSMSIRIPFLAKDYYSPGASRSSHRFSNVYPLLTKLIFFSARMHFISDSYSQISAAVTEEFEKERLLYEEKQQKAVVNFEAELNRRLVPVESLNHKTALAYAKRNGIEHILIPFFNDLKVTELPNISFALYNKENKRESENWLLLPPTKEPLVMPGMEYHGVHDYITYDATTYLSSNGKAPHIVNEQSRVNTRIDEDLFNHVFLKEYAETPYAKALTDAFVLINEFPKALFAMRTEDVFNAGVLEEVQEELWAPANPFANLETRLFSFIDEPTGESRILKVGSLVVGDKVPPEQQYSKLLENGLFSIQAISVEGSAEEARLLVDLLPLYASPDFSEFQEEESFQIELAYPCLYAASEQVIHNLIRNLPRVTKDAHLYLTAYGEKEMHSAEAMSYYAGEAPIEPAVVSNQPTPFAPYAPRDFSPSDAFATFFDDVDEDDDSDSDSDDSDSDWTPIDWPTAYPHVAPTASSTASSALEQKDVAFIYDEETDDVLIMQKGIITWRASCERGYYDESEVKDTLLSHLNRASSTRKTELGIIIPGNTYLFPVFQLQTGSVLTGIPYYN